MADLSRIHIGKQARALAAALVIGMAILSLAPGQTAYAVVTTPGSGDVDTGDQGSGPASRKPKPASTPVYCVLTRQDGTIEFHEHGAIVTVNGRTFYCTASGHWMEVYGPPVPTQDTVPGGGVNKPAP